VVTRKKLLIETFGVAMLLIIRRRSCEYNCESELKLCRGVNYEPTGSDQA
jgi:hypothetical protein